MNYSKIRFFIIPMAASFFCSLFSGCTLFEESVEPVKNFVQSAQPGVWPPTKLSEAEKNQLRMELETHRDLIKKWAPTCDASITNPPTLTSAEETVMYPGNDGKYSDQITERAYGYHGADGKIVWEKCSQWDTNARAGLLCLAAFVAGDDETMEYRCRDTKLAQDPSTGRWLRGFIRRGVEKWKCENNYSNPNDPEYQGVQCPELHSFSRDALEGTITYWIATKDAESAKKWLAWVRKTSKNPNQLMMCESYVANSNTCLITPGAWATLGKVWQHLGLPQEPEMIKYAYATAANDLLGALGARLVEFQMVLTGAWIDRVLKKLSGIETNLAQEKVARLVADDAAAAYPLNLLAEYSKTGVTRQFVDNIKSRCPAQRPDYDAIFKGYTEDFQVPIPAWSWGREDKYQPWLYSSGHDCIFLLDVAIGDLKMYD